MGTKRPSDEELQEFTKHPKYLENGNKPNLFGEEKSSLETEQPIDEEIQEFIKHPKHLENGNKPDSFGEEKPSLETKQPFDAELNDFIKHPKHLENGNNPYSFGEERPSLETKQPFDEEIQEFIKHPKHLENGNKPDSFGEERPSLEPSQNAAAVGEGGETSAPLPLVTGITGHEEASGPGPSSGFCPNLFSEFYEFNLPRRPLVHYDDTYSPLLNCTPRKEVPIGPEYQADVPEFDPDAARNYISNNEREQILNGICVISNQEDEIVTPQTNCQCVDNGSIRCVQQHVNEARLNLKESLLLEKFVNLGFDNIGEEVSSNWTEEEEQHFQDIIYSNPASHGKRFWEVLSSEFPTRTKKELVSYYFNVFIYRRRAVQNRSHLLAIDSDDDEWWGTKKGSFGSIIEDDDLVAVGPFVNHGDHHDQDHYNDHDSSSEDGDMVTRVKEYQVMNACSSSDIHDEKVTSETNLEKPAPGTSFGSKSESYLHWDPPYSTMGSTKGVDLLPTCSMIEEIFGSSKTGKNT